MRAAPARSGAFWAGLAVVPAGHLGGGAGRRGPCHRRPRSFLPTLRMPGSARSASAPLRLATCPLAPLGRSDIRAPELRCSSARPHPPGSEFRVRVRTALRVSVASHTPQPGPSQEQARDRGPLSARPRTVCARRTPMRQDAARQGRTTPSAAQQEEALRDDDVPRTDLGCGVVPGHPPSFSGLDLRTVSRDGATSPVPRTPLGSASSRGPQRRLLVVTMLAPDDTRGETSPWPT